MTEELCIPGEPPVPVEREPSPFPQAVQNLPAPSSKAPGSTSPKMWDSKLDPPPGKVHVAPHCSQPSEGMGPPPQRCLGLCGREMVISVFEGDVWSWSHHLTPCGCCSPLAVHPP